MTSGKKERATEPFELTVVCETFKAEGYRVSSHPPILNGKGHLGTISDRRLTLLPSSTEPRAH